MMKLAKKVARQQLDLSASYLPIAIKQWKLSPPRLKPLKQLNNRSHKYYMEQLQYHRDPLLQAVPALDKYSDSTQYSTSKYINILSVGNVYSYTIPSFNNGGGYSVPVLW